MRIHKPPSHPWSSRLGEDRKHIGRNSTLKHAVRQTQRPPGRANGHFSLIRRPHTGDPYALASTDMRERHSRTVHHAASGFAPAPSPNTWPPPTLDQILHAEAKRAPRTSHLSNKTGAETAGIGTLLTATRRRCFQMSRSEARLRYSRMRKVGTNTVDEVEMFQSRKDCISSIRSKRYKPPAGSDVLLSISNKPGALSLPSLLFYVPNRLIRTSLLALI